MEPNSEYEDKRAAANMLTVFLVLVTLVSLSYALYEHNRYTQLASQINATPVNANNAAGMGDLSPAAGSSGSDMNSSGMSATSPVDNGTASSGNFTGSSGIVAPDATSGAGAINSSGNSSGATMAPDNYSSGVSATSGGTMAPSGVTP